MAGSRTRLLPVREPLMSSPLEDENPEVTEIQGTASETEQPTRRSRTALQEQGRALSEAMALLREYARRHTPAAVLLFKSCVQICNLFNGRFSRESTHTS